MMSSPTDSADHLMFYAQERAQQMGAAEVSTGHVLLACAEQGLLGRDTTLTPEAVRRELSRVLGGTRHERRSATLPVPSERVSRILVDLLRVDLAPGERLPARVLAAAVLAQDGGVATEIRRRLQRTLTYA